MRHHYDAKYDSPLCIYIADASVDVSEEVVYSHTLHILLLSSHVRLYMFYKYRGELEQFCGSVLYLVDLKGLRFKILGLSVTIKFSYLNNFICWIFSFFWEMYLYLSLI
jgi:hypothetical protein